MEKEDELREIEGILEDMAHKKILKRIKKDGENHYKLSSKGMKEAEKVINTPDGAIFLFTIMFNESKMREQYPDPHRRLLEVAKEIRDISKMNILRVLLRYQHKITGLVLRSDIPEAFLKRFDLD